MFKKISQANRDPDNPLGSRDAAHACCRGWNYQPWYETSDCSCLLQIPPSVMCSQQLSKVLTELI